MGTFLASFSFFNLTTIPSYHKFRYFAKLNSPFYICRRILFIHNLNNYKRWKTNF